MPLLLVVERRHVNASFEVGAGDLHDLVQRALDTVVDRADQTGTELNGERCAGGLHLFSGTETGGLLIDLNRGSVAVHFYDFANQTLAADAHNVKHIGVAHALGDDQRTRDLCDNSFFQWIHLNR